MQARAVCALVPVSVRSSFIDYVPVVASYGSVLPWAVVPEVRQCLPWFFLKKAVFAFVFLTLFLSS